MCSLNPNDVMILVHRWYDDDDDDDDVVYFYNA